MTKQKSTKRALLSSAIALFVCVAMLIGTTFAWFTDSVTSKGNIIKSGTLDVEMYWAKGTEDPVADATSWADASKGAIFDYDKWEPGYVEARHIKIENAGTLALKYKLNILATGEVSKLAEVIDVYYLDPAKKLEDRDALTAANKIGSLKDVLANVATTATGSLEAKKSVSITIALKMREEAGNEYQGLSIGSEFAIQLLATQYTYEKDSFNNQYDFKATYLNQDASGAWLINNIDELYYFASEVNSGNTYEGQTVKLTADIDLGGYRWIPIGQTGATEFKGIFDGNGYTIKNLSVDNTAYTDEHTSTGLFGWAESGVTIKNVKIDGATMKGNHNVAAIVGYTYSSKIINCHVSNATIINTHANGDACGDKTGTIVGYAGDEARITNCSASDSTVKAGRDAGQLIGAGYNVSVSGCSATNVTVSANGDCTGANINNAIIGRVLG